MKQLGQSQCPVERTSPVNIPCRPPFLASRKPFPNPLTSPSSPNVAATRSTPLTLYRTRPPSTLRFIDGIPGRSRPSLLERMTYTSLSRGAQTQHLSIFTLSRSHTKYWFLAHSHIPTSPLPWELYATLSARNTRKTNLPLFSVYMLTTRPWRHDISSSSY